MKVLPFGLGLVFGLMFCIFPKSVDASLVNSSIDCSSMVVDKSAGTANVTFSIEPDVINVIRTDYAVTGGTAQGNGVDYTFPNGTIEFPVGTTEVKVPLLLNANTPWHAIEWKSIQITTSNGYYGNTSFPEPMNETCTIYISDHLSGPTFTLSASSNSGSETVGKVNMTITLSNSAAAPFSILLESTPVVSTDDASRGVDFDFPDSVLVPTGATTVVVPITIVNDAYKEKTEGLRLKVKGVTWGAYHPSAPNGTFNYTILDDDTETTVPATSTPLIGTTAVYNFLQRNGKFVVPGTATTMRPTAAGFGFNGSYWAKRVTLRDTQATTIFIIIPLTPFKYGTIDVYAKNGNALQGFKPAGSFITRGAMADLVVQPSSTTPILAFAHLNGSTVKLYEVTSTGLVARGQVVVNRKNFSGNLIVGYRKLYGTDYGLVTMVKGRTSTLQVWKYNPVKKTFSIDTTKATLAKLKVTADKITLK